MSDALPRLIVVSGRPGSGKTTLARQLSSVLRLPLIERDALKEGRVATTADRGEPGGEEDRDAFHAFFGILQRCAETRVSIVADAAFAAPNWQAGLVPFADRVMLRVIVCRTNVPLAHERWTERERADPDWSRYHHPLPPIESWTYELPSLPGPMMFVDTSDGYRPGLQEILAFTQSGA